MNHTKKLPSFLNMQEGVLFKKHSLRMMSLSMNKFAADCLSLCHIQSMSLQGTRSNLRQDVAYTNLLLNETSHRVKSAHSVHSNFVNVSSLQRNKISISCPDSYHLIYLNFTFTVKWKTNNIQMY